MTTSWRSAWAGGRAPLLAVLLVVLGAAASGCGRASVFQPRRPEPGDVVAARIGGDVVWASDVRREAVAQGLIGDADTLEPGSETFRRTLDQVIDQRLLAHEAQRLGLDRDPVVRRRLEAAREKLLGDVLVDSVVDRAVNDSAVRALYQEQQRLAHAADEFHARQIVTASETDAEAVKKLLAAGASFEGLAMQRSIDGATRFNGGDLGYFTLDSMPEAYGAVLKGAKPGALLGPVKTDAGYVLLKVEDRRPEKPITIDAARPQIVRFLTYDEIRNLLDRLRSGAHVEVLATTAKPAAPDGHAPKTSTGGTSR